MFKENIINIPNTLTLIRLITIPFFVIALFSGKSVAALTIFFLIAAADVIDGFLARTFKQTTDFGKAFDGIVDGVLIAVALIALFVMNGVSLFWVIILLIPKGINFILQVIYSNKRKKVVAVKSIIGKIGAGSVYVAIMALIINSTYKIHLLIISTVLIYISGIKHALDVKKR